MTGTVDRISGAFFFVLGLVIYFLINPNFIETVDGGNLAPSTFPNILAIILAVCGAILLFKPTNQQVPDMRDMLVTSAYVAVLVAGLYSMSIFGFEYIAPILALVIMLAIGERRPLWLGSGVVAMPALIWFLVTVVLGRALP